MCPEQIDILIVDDNRDFTSALSLLLKNLCGAILHRQPVISILEHGKDGIVVAKKIANSELSVGVIALDEHLADGPDMGSSVAIALAKAGYSGQIIGVSANGFQVDWPEISTYIGKDNYIAAAEVISNALKIQMESQTS